IACAVAPSSPDAYVVASASDAIASTLPLAASHCLIGRPVGESAGSVRQRGGNGSGIAFAALVGLVDDALVADADRTDHQQAQVAHDVVGQRAVPDVVAMQIQAEILALQTAAVAEVDFEIEHDPLLFRLRH